MLATEISSITKTILINIKSIEDPFFSDVKIIAHTYSNTWPSIKAAYLTVGAPSWLRKLRQLCYFLRRGIMFS